VTGVSLLVAVALLLANGFFVAVEFAVLASRRTKLEAMADGGSATTMRVRSGSEMAMFLGTISPTTMWRNTTMSRATTNPMVWSTPGGTSTKRSTAPSMSPATAGSAT
jgi:CBS domain containing-hemolysin-like protein